MKKPFKVADKYRKNDLSLIPGGVTVRVEYKDGKAPRDYTNIHNAEAYIRRMQNNEDVANAYVLPDPTQP